jgi:hypothetical protein
MDSTFFVVSFFFVFIFLGGSLVSDQFNTAFPQLKGHSSPFSLSNDQISENEILNLQENQNQQNSALSALGLTEFSFGFAPTPTLSVAPPPSSPLLGLGGASENIFSFGTWEAPITTTTTNPTTPFQLQETQGQVSSSLTPSSPFSFQPPVTGFSFWPQVAPESTIPTLFSFGGQQQTVNSESGSGGLNVSSISPSKDAFVFDFSQETFRGGV